MNRKLEKTLGIIGAGLVLVLMGGFALTIMNISFDQFVEVIAPAFQDSVVNVASEEGFETVRTLAAWFAVTAFVTLALVALANLLMNRYPNRAAVCYFVTGLVVLFGSQLIAYPLAFIFFVVAALALLRKETV